GDAVRLQSGTASFHTSVHKILGADALTVIGSPEPGHRPMQVPGATHQVYCANERGIYIFEAEVTDVRSGRGDIIVALRAAGALRRVQRREAFRAWERLAVNARLKAAEGAPPSPWLETEAVNISETGMLLRFNKPCKPGRELDLILRIDHLGIQATLPELTGRVARCIETGHVSFGYLLGVRFEDMPKRARDLIIKLVVLSQRSEMSLKQTKRYG
ncbi:MAG: hypothetical protein GX585_05020, partial [Clostridiales bacterium]|nr:hypothetical protein [Clostridiales bacterium]